MFGEIFGNQFDFSNVRCISAYVDVFIATAIEVLKRKSGNPLFGSCSQVVDRRESTVKTFVAHIANLDWSILSVPDQENMNL